MTIADEEENWLPAGVVVQGRGEFSYPALCQTADGIIHLVYTYRRKHIQHAWFTESWLLGEEPEHAA